MHNSHTCRPAALQIVNKIGSKLCKRTIPAINAKSTQSILVLWECIGGTQTSKNWEILARCDQGRWENMVYHENALKMEFCCSFPPNSEYAHYNTVCHCFYHPAGQKHIPPPPDRWKKTCSQRTNEVSLKGSLLVFINNLTIIPDANGVSEVELAGERPSFYN